MGLLKGDLLMGYKNFWILLIMLLTGIVLGGFIGQLADGVVWLKLRPVLRSGHPSGD